MKKTVFLELNITALKSVKGNFFKLINLFFFHLRKYKVILIKKINTNKV